jgi:hypothetical protein
MSSTSRTSSESVIRSPPNESMNSRTSAGCLTARLPITTRPTPASNMRPICPAVLKPPAT